jgi:hypothetical protein
MKDLKEYLYQPDLNGQRWMNENYLKNFYDDYDEYSKLLNYSNIIEIIEENLLSHDVRELKEKILKYFPGVRFVDHNKSKHNIKSFYVTYHNCEALVNDDDFWKLIEFYNYRIEGHNEISILLDPIFPQKIDMYDVKALYHITTCDNIDSILSKGLRPKSGQYTSRPERVYFYASDEYIKDFPKNENIISIVGKVLPFTKTQRYGWCVFKVDLEKLRKDKHYLGLYKDDMMKDDDGCVFSNVMIPKEYIKLVYKTK